MSVGLSPGRQPPDFELPDDAGTMRRLSELQGDDLMAVMPGRGEHRPRERQPRRSTVESCGWCAVAFTQPVTILPKDQHDTNTMRLGTGARWPCPCDFEYEVQRRLDIRKCTDPHHRATVPHTLVLGTGPSITKVDVGYRFRGRPAPHRLWPELQQPTRRVKADDDPTVPDLRADWERTQAAAVDAARGGR
jgi:hypothetical protein